MPVKIKRERPSRRQHHRVTAPLFVTVRGHTARAADWSLSGIRVEDFPGEIPAKGEHVELHLSLPFQGFEIAFDATGEIVRSDVGRSMFALQFDELGARERDLMHHFIGKIIRGSMVDVEDTIQRIDVPVTPVSTKPDPNPQSDIPVRRWPLRTIFFSTFYLVLGLVVFGYVGLMLYANFYRLEVQAAVITAPIETVRAQFDGRIIWDMYRPGDKVHEGDVLLRVADNELEKAIDLAAIAVREREARLGFLRQRLADERARMESFADIERKNVEQTRLDVERLAAAAKAAEARYKRLSKLFALGYTTRSVAEEAEKEQVAAGKRLAIRQIELQSRRSLAASNIGKRHYTGQNFVGDIARIRAEAALAENKIKIARGKYEVLLKHRRRLAVRAPFDGSVLELPRVDQSAVKEGDTVAVLEKAGRRHVVAYLKQDEVLQIGLGDAALAYLPALDETLRLRVDEIDRTSGFIDEQQSRYSWRGTKDRSARVALEFAEPSLIDDSARYRTGLPAIVIFNSRSTNQFAHEVRKRLMVLFSDAALGLGNLAPAKATLSRIGRRIGDLITHGAAHTRQGLNDTLSKGPVLASGLLDRHALRDVATAARQRVVGNGAWILDAARAFADRAIRSSDRRQHGPISGMWS